MQVDRQLLTKDAGDGCASFLRRQPGPEPSQQFTEPSQPFTVPCQQFTMPSGRGWSRGPGAPADYLGGRNLMQVPDAGSICGLCDHSSSMR